MSLLSKIVQGWRIPQLPHNRLLGPKRARMLIDGVNAFLNLQIVRGERDQLIVAPGSAILTLKETSTTRSGSTDAGMHYRGEYNSGNDYVSGDVVYVGAETVRAWYICTADNGSADPHGPPDDSYWIKLGPSWHGLYSSASSYPPLAMVYTRGANSTWSLWISEIEVPVSTAPAWPEPEAPSTLYWRMMGMSGDAYAVDVCEGGSETTYYFYGPPDQ